MNAGRKNNTKIFHDIDRRHVRSRNSARIELHFYVYFNHGLIGREGKK